MNPLEILQSVKKIVFGEETPAAAPVAPVEKVFSEYQLKDGTSVSIDKLEVGGVVMLGDAPAPAGSHELSDGTMLEVGEGGMIAAVTAPVAPVGEDMNKKYESRFSQLEQNFSTLQTELQSAKQETEGFKVALSKADEAIKGLVNLVETMVKTPSTTPSEPVKSGFRRDGESKDEKLNRLIQLFKQQ